jgi:hypothetical protein
MSSAGRPIASCLAVFVAGLVLLGWGSGNDSTSADIDPQIASDLTGQLDKIRQFFQDGNCDRASKAVDGLRKGINGVSGSTGEQFTADALELTDNLANRVEDQCVEETNSTTTEPTTDTIPTTTEPPTTEPPTTTTTETTTTETTTKETTTSTPEPPTAPPGNPGGGNPGGGPGGGITPGGGNGKKGRVEGHGPKEPKDHGNGRKKERGG